MDWYKYQIIGSLERANLLKKKSLSSVMCERCGIRLNHESTLVLHQWSCKEKKMNDQMEQVWRSKDGQCTGSKEEVEAYLKTKNPLAGMRFPYRTKYNAGTYSLTIHQAEDKPYADYASKEEKEALVAFANLAPLIQELAESWEINPPQHIPFGTCDAIMQLLLAYDKALKQVPQ